MAMGLDGDFIFSHRITTLSRATRLLARKTAPSLLCKPPVLPWARNGLLALPSLASERGAGGESG
jgi:hypothetical protein